MAKRVIASSWKVISADNTGALVDIYFNCPYCDFEGGELTLIGAVDASKVHTGFEIDQVCEWCNKEVVVECRK